MSVEPIRIAHVIDNLRPDGTQRALLYLVAGLSRKGYCQRVYALNSGSNSGLVQALESYGAEVVTIGKAQVVLLIGLFRLAGSVRRWRPHVVQTVLPVSDLVGRCVARMVGTPVIVTGIRARNIDKPAWMQRLDRLTMRWADRVTFNSREVVAFAMAEEGVRAEQVVVIPNGVVPPADGGPQRGREFRKTLGIDETARVAGMMARLYPQKNHDLLLRAFARISRALPDAWLLLAGRGPLQAVLEEKARRLGVVSRVRFLGHCSDTGALLAALDVYVHPSLFEGMSNAVMEAMSAGKPVIASDVDGTRELIEDGRSGWLVPPCDVDALAERLLMTLNDPEQARRVGASAARRVATEFSVERMVEAYDRLYRGLLAENL